MFLVFFVSFQFCVFPGVCVVCMNSLVYVVRGFTSVTER